jgi:hypothetical protein
MLSVFLGLLGVFLERINLLQNLRFNGEGDISSFHHISQFNWICNNLDIIDTSEICILFTLTLRGRIRSWFQVLPNKSIHSWKQFMELFYATHEDQYYEEPCLELENLCKYEGESVEYFLLKFKSICFRFHLDDKPSAKDLFEKFIFCLFLIYRDNKIMINIRIIFSYTCCRKY